MRGEGAKKSGDRRGTEHDYRVLSNASAEDKGVADISSWGGR